MDKHSYTGGGVYFDHSGPSAGLAQISQPMNTATPDTSFYQWVPFVLVLQVIWFRHSVGYSVLFQASLFYIPRKIWKSCEGGLIESFGIYDTFFLFVVFTF